MEDEFPISTYLIHLLRWLLPLAVIVGVAFLPLTGEPEGLPSPDAQATAPAADPLPKTSKMLSATFNDQSYEPEFNLGPQIQELYHAIILDVADRYEVDPALIKAIIMAESGYDPNAVSKRGAAGLMQLMPETATALGVEDIFNPEHNIEGGVRYFKKMVNKFDGDVKLALAAYNAGCRMVLRYQGIPPFKATQFYIQKVFKYYQFFKNQTVDDINEV